jgi:hypothetical protein
LTLACLGVAFVHFGMAVACFDIAVVCFGNAVVCFDIAVVCFGNAVVASTRCGLVRRTSWCALTFPTCCPP